MAAEVRPLVPNEVLTRPTTTVALIHHADHPQPTMYVEVVVPRTLTHAFIEPSTRKACTLELFKQLRDDLDFFLTTFHQQGGQA